MKKATPIIMALMLLVSLLTVASVQALEIVTREMIQEETVTETDLIKTADNFIILFDTSGSTNEMVPGKSISKIQASKNLLKERNAWLPELGFQAGLYEYTNNETLAGTFKEIYGMQPYDRERFAAAIDQLPEKGEGPTMLQAGFRGLRKVVNNLSGKTAIIMFTDGTASVVRGPKRPLQIAQEIARDNDVCFYLISSATEEVNAQLLEAASTVNACSRVIPIAAFMDNPQYLSGALFTVKTTSYTRLKPMTQTVGVLVDDVLYDFDSSIIPSAYNDNLDQLGDYLLKNPDAFLVVGGFADSAGDEEYNMWLSKRRALSIKTYLLETVSIDADRIVLQWFGEQNPAADNATEEGRRLNRRAELAVGNGGGMQLPLFNMDNLSTRIFIAPGKCASRSLAYQARLDASGQKPYITVDAINGLRSRVSAGANMRKGPPGFYRVIERILKIQVSGAVGMRILKESDQKESTVIFFQRKNLAEEIEAVLSELNAILALHREGNEVRVELREY